jgi:hypothetical protein
VKLEQAARTDHQSAFERSERSLPETNRLILMPFNIKLERFMVLRSQINFL